jgi:hydrogenase assembly chaperone HypC/HupF
MCLILPAKVIAVDGPRAEVELHGGGRATVGCDLVQNVAAGDFVLVDRGLVLQVIAPAEAEAILAMYAEIGELLAEEPAQ